MQLIIPMTEIKPGVYEHYKGQCYEVIGLARHSEILEEMVVYRALYASEKFGDRALWVRPAAIFRESVVVGDKEVPRFRYIG